jgi:hypothetical protein
MCCCISCGGCCCLHDCCCASYCGCCCCRCCWPSGSCSSMQSSSSMLHKSESRSCSVDWLPIVPKLSLRTGASPESCRTAGHKEAGYCKHTESAAVLPLLLNSNSSLLNGTAVQSRPPAWCIRQTTGCLSTCMRLLMLHVLATQHKHMPAAQCRVVDVTRPDAPRLTPRKAPLRRRLCQCMMCNRFRATSGPDSRQSG